ncbi:hypothetical protein SCH01S_33_00020 [Sphingomonas changbaiensis NBRC 104936]|uniref:Uncharacterized protein n=2 Tax=Sphingomonas changbaiensis TaxID=529705 RepID=A0A0E9MQW2_9SPHN|nr:hypothetical protein SCH01S_33_00020 [Sphingomonas changbaiensis NBRC 104936]
MIAISRGHQSRFGLSLSKPSLSFLMHARKNKEGLRQAQAKPRAGRALVLIGLTLVATPAAARDNLGMFETWGAFRDASPPRCFAIAEPVRATPKDAQWRPFASVAVWPALHQRNQLHIRLRRPVAKGSRVTLAIGRNRFPLIAGGADAWSPDARSDAAIVAAMRSADRMTVSAPGSSDTYALRGAATAIDAATLGCARR